jgi:hypothetical protein
MKPKQSPALAQILKLLPQLKPAEQIEVQSKLGFLMMNLSEPKEKPGTSDWLAEGIVYELDRRGLAFKRLHGYWQKLAPIRFDKVSLAVRGSLERGFDKPLTEPQKYVLGRVVAMALVDYLANKWNARPLTLKSVLEAVPDTLAALDESYPGYLAAGMLGRLIGVK